MLAFSSGYRQVALTTNKHRIVHALKHELPVCLFSHVRILAVLDEKRTRAKSSDFLYVLIQAVRTERTRGLKIRRRVPHCEIRCWLQVFKIAFQRAIVHGCVCLVGLQRLGGITLLPLEAEARFIVAVVW